MQCLGSILSVFIATAIHVHYTVECTITNFLWYLRSDFVYDLFEYMNVDGGSSGGGIQSRRPTALGKRGGKPSRKKATVSSQFKVSNVSL